MRGLFFVLLIFGGVLLAAQNPEEDYIVRDKALVKYQGDSLQVVIPPGLGINRIGRRAFMNANIQSLVIPMGVGYIDEQAFMECSFLKSVTLPNTLITLGRRAFFNCTMLETINIPRSLVTIEDGAFYNCVSLKVINLPDTLRSLGSRVFAGCFGLEKLSVSRRTKLGDNPFMGVRPEVIEYKK